MAELNKKYLKLRTVRLEEVARYLDCNPEKLRTALKHLGENPSAIQYEIGKAASIGPAASVRALEARASAEEAAIRAEEEANSRVITAWEKCHISMMSWTR